MSDFASLLQEHMNTTVTGNGDPTYASTLNANLDLFSKAGGVRSNNYYQDAAMSTENYQTMFLDALAEDGNTAIRNLLNIRDFRHDGKGERQLFRELLVTLANTHEDLVKPLIVWGAVQELGRWDDLIYLYSHAKSVAVKNAVVYVLKQELKVEDSLLPKWMPTNTRNKEQYAVAKQLANALGYDNFSKYRKAIVAMRKRLNLIETNLTTKNYDAIEVDKVPSRAFQKYKTALFTHKEDDMHEYLDAVTKGEKQLKVTGVTPNEILKPYTDQFTGRGNQPVKELDDNQKHLIEASWQALVDGTRDAGNTLIIADTSGSMMGTPMSVAVSLAILFAQKMTGPLHGRFMTFSDKSDFIMIGDDYTLAQKVSKVMSADWGGSTNIEAAFKNILDTAVYNQMSQEDMPKRIVIISDMQFNIGGREPHIKRWKKNFADEGYKLPDVVYWNVSSYSNSPATAFESGVAIISGFTTGTLNAVIDGDEITPVSIMMNALNKPEYDVADEVAPK